MLLTIMTYHYCSCIRVLSSLHVYGFTATCFSCMAYSTHAQCCSGPRACGSSNVSCAIVIYLSCNVVGPSAGMRFRER